MTWVRSAFALAGAAIVLAGCGAGGTTAAPAKTTATPASTSTGPAAVVGSAEVVNAPTRIAHTAAGPVGYREVGTGSPILIGSERSENLVAGCRSAVLSFVISVVPRSSGTRTCR